MQSPKVLLYDTENCANIVYAWGTYETDALKVIRHRQIICFSWKWLGEKKTHVLALPDLPGYKPGDTQASNKLLMRKMYDLWGEADIVVGHNVKKFDDKRSNGDMAKHDFTPPPPHRQVDTLEFARSKFDFNSNRLGDLGEFLGLGTKVKHPGFEMWEGCDKGDPKMWSLMKKYCAGDTDLLEKIYLKLRPWMMRHPNMNAVDGVTDQCPYCRSKNLVSRGFSISNTGKRPRFMCKDCGKWSVGEKKEGSPWKFK